jgi:DnaJ-class molecular chaperone
MIEQLAKKYHPDTNKEPAAHDKFVEIQDAYEVNYLPSSRRDL